VRVDALGETLLRISGRVVTADGRLVTKAVDGALVERKLSAEGVQRLRNEAIGSGLFVSDRQISLELAPGATRRSMASTRERSGCGTVRGP